MSNASKIVSFAKSKRGVKEGTSAHREIVDTFNKNYNGYTLKYTDSWCDAFVTYVFIMCGMLDLIGAECSCGRHIELFKSKGIWIEDDNITPKSGDIILYDWDRKDSWPEHIGIVTSVSGSTIYVEEGNYSNQVKQRAIKVGDSAIRGYARPKYEGASVKPTPKPETTPTPVPSPTINNWVSRVQTECNAQGFSNQKVDGIAGPITLKGCPTLRYGSRGNITKLMQERLIYLGYDVGGYGADGVFGRGTKADVIAYQKSKYLVADGIVGQKTWAKLLGL